MKAKAEDPEGSMTSMIDVVFLLLIFFMCAAKFKTLDSVLAMNLPKDIGGPSMQSPEITPMRIELLADRFSIVDGKTVVRSISVVVGESHIGKYLRPFFGQDNSEQEQLKEKRKAVYAQLANYLDKQQNTRTFIAPDERIPNADVIQVLNTALAANITDLTFSGKGSDIQKLRKEDGISE